MDPQTRVRINPQRLSVYRVYSQKRVDICRDNIVDNCSRQLTSVNVNQQDLVANTDVLDWNSHTTCQSNLRTVRNATRARDYREAVRIAAGRRDKRTTQTRRGNRETDKTEAAA